MTIDVRGLYPDMEEPFYGPGDYTPIVNAIGTRILRVDQENWQGDTWVLYRDNGRWGYLCFGWGSCSGCDALQACSTYAELQSLANDIEASVQWKPLAEMREWFQTHDFEGDWAWTYDEFQKFVRRAREVLALAVE